MNRDYKMTEKIKSDLFDFSVLMEFDGLKLSHVSIRSLYENTPFPYILTIGAEFYIDMHMDDALNLIIDRLYNYTKKYTKRHIYAIVLINKAVLIPSSKDTVIIAQIKDTNLDGQEIIIHNDN